MFATSFVLGYHGCDKKIGEKILGSGDHVAPSSNAYDWLGAGAYFWENSPKRALSWAEFLKKHPVIADHKIETPIRHRRHHRSGQLSRSERRRIASDH